MFICQELFINTNLKSINNNLWNDEYKFTFCQHILLFKKFNLK